MLGTWCPEQDRSQSGRPGASRLSLGEIRYHCEFALESQYEVDADEVKWEVKHPYTTLEWVGSENIQGVDGPQNPAETGVLPGGADGQTV